MKVVEITRCSECPNYNLKKHRCIKGASDHPDYTESFYRDCPLMDVESYKSTITVRKIDEEVYVLYEQSGASDFKAKHHAKYVEGYADALRDVFVILKKEEE